MGLVAHHCMLLVLWQQIADMSVFPGQAKRSENPTLATEINPKFSWLEDFEVDDEDNDEACLNCPRWIPANYPLDLAAMWLHAMEYSCTAWTFQCPPPKWSEPDWDPSEFEMK